VVTFTVWCVSLVAQIVKFKAVIVNTYRRLNRIILPLKYLPGATANLLDIKMESPVDLFHFKKYAFILFCLSLCLQLPTLLGLFTVTTPQQKSIYGSIEMLLIALLLLNGWSIWRVLKRKYATQGASYAWILEVAKFCFISLALCVMGDLINRNFLELYYQYGSNVEHTYLADSVWFFFPGYSCFIYAVYLVARHKNLSLLFVGYTALIFIGIGILSFAGIYKEGAGAYVATMTGGYASLISVMCAAALWLLKSYGWQAMKWVALGAVLAPVADSLIGNFWIYREGYFPGISYVNWIVYFTSQALIQQLPVKLSQLSS